MTLNPPTVVSQLPDEIKNAPVAHVQYDGAIFVCMGREPFQCPTCRSVRGFFLLRQRSPLRSLWSYECIGCDNRRLAA